MTGRGPARRSRRREPLERERNRSGPPDWNCSGCNMPDAGCPREIDTEPYCCGTCRATAGRSHGR